MAADGWYTYTGREAVPRHVTRVRIDKSISVIPARAFYQHPNITELYCHDGVKKVEQFAFIGCRSLRRVIMPGVKEVERRGFCGCVALADVECGKLEIIGVAAFGSCLSLINIDLPSAKFVGRHALDYCKALTNVEFGSKLESIRDEPFAGCISLERITLPLKDGMISDHTFQGCKKMKHVDLVEVAILHETIAALQMEEWKHEMNEEIVSINQILPTTPAGNVYFQDVGGKGREVRLWIRSVLHKIVHYKAQHQSYVNEAATTLQLALPSDIVCKNVLPFLELPSSFELED
eukprot:scaffold3345_cov83-Skeletonema_dohrnii-CCMP3373.AAC.5